MIANRLVDAPDVVRGARPAVNSIMLDVVTRTAHRILAHLGHRTVKGAPCGSSGPGGLFDTKANAV